MTDFREDIASVIEDAIDSVHDMDVTHADYARAAADALIAALPMMVAEENKRLRDALYTIKIASACSSSRDVARAALQVNPLRLKFIGIVQDMPEGPHDPKDNAP